MSILVTGGAGYIGSHTLIELINEGNEVVVIDNLSNSCLEALKRVEKITATSIKFYEGNILNIQLLENIFNENNISAVIHFAGLKAVGESNDIPLSYYQNNVSTSISLFQVMAKHCVKKLVFSSSATVYGENNLSPLDESMPTSATNPYGQTKLMIERVLFDLAKSDSEWSIACLRYFNPIGAHSSGLIGENPNGIPNNLLPYVAQVAVGLLPKLQIFGDDYDTPDGTGVRDYIHVVDLARGHVKALEALNDISGCHPINLGTGKGTSVLEIVNSFKEASGEDIPYEIVARRPGDIGTMYANASFANRLLNWQADRKSVV